MPKGIRTKIVWGAVRRVAGASPHDFVGEGRGSGAPLYWAKMQHVSLLYQGRRIAHDICNLTTL
eukprot:2089832-Ditylum_brightwellii.AAC.1